MTHSWLLKSKWLALLPLLALLAGMAAACGGNGDTPVPRQPTATTAAPAAAPTEAPPAEAMEEAEVLKIGGIFYLTGALAWFGSAQYQVAQMQIDEINAAGGLKVGDKTYKIELIAIDGPIEFPERSRTAATKLVFDEEVKFIIGNGDPMDTATQVVTEPNKVIFMGTSGNPYLYGEKNYMFDNFSAVHFYAEPYLEALFERHPDLNTVMYLQTNQKWDLNNVEPTKKAVEKLGKEWLGVQVYDRGIVDFAPTATAVVAKKPDVILLGEIIEDAPAIIKAIRELGWEGQIQATSLSYSLEDVLKGLEGVEHYVEGFMQVDYGHTSPSPEGAKFMEEYEARWGQWDAWALGDWFHLTFLFEAIQRVGTIDDPDAIMAELEQIRLQYPYYPGEWMIEAGGTETVGKKRVLKIPKALSVIQDGKPHTIDVVVPIVP
jgi:branched-chain amino acid transport system substrate-binding protein